MTANKDFTVNATGTVVIRGSLAGQACLVADWAVGFEVDSGELGNEVNAFVAETVGSASSGAIAIVSASIGTFLVEKLIDIIIPRDTVNGQAFSISSQLVMVGAGDTIGGVGSCASDAGWVTDGVGFLAVTVLEDIGIVAAGATIDITGVASLAALVAWLASGV